MNEDCIFCKLVAGRIDSYTVYEDEHALAFLDVNPVSRGHTLVVPKTHAAELTDLDSEMVGNLFQAVHRIASGLDAELAPDGLNVLQSNGTAAGQEIFHMHVHLIPRYPEDGFHFAFDQKALDEAEASRLAETLSKRLR